MENQEWLDIKTAPRDGTRIISYVVDSQGCDEIFMVSWLGECEDGPAGWWDDYGGNYNPSYWIPVPKHPKKRHQCGEEFECYIDEDGVMRLQIYDQHGRMTTLLVNFCPFCGEKAEDE
jgi:hypothetical protein